MKLQELRAMQEWQKSGQNLTMVRCELSRAEFNRMVSTWGSGAGLKQSSGTTYHGVSDAHLTIGNPSFILSIL